MRVYAVIVFSLLLSSCGASTGERRVTAPGWTRVLVEWTDTRPTAEAT